MAASPSNRLGVEVGHDLKRHVQRQTASATCQYFVDGREGEDRWGTPYKDKQACGLGWDEYVCPAYEEESCPGCKNPGNRIAPCQRQSCGTSCGTCGGGGRSYTMAYCGQDKSLFQGSAWTEMGGSLRLDRYTADPPQNPAWDLPVNWFPVVEQERADKKDDTTWMTELGSWPAVATTLKTAWSGMFSSRRTPLRQKLGIGEDTQLVVNGLVLDDLLDEAWDEREGVLESLLEDGVDVMIPPQFSAYADLQNWMALYNANRVFEWHTMAVEMGFKHVGLQHPGYQARWLLDEYFDFAERSKINLISISAQTSLLTMGGYNAEDMLDFKLCHENYPKDATFIVFGPSNQRLIVQAQNVMKGRRVIYANVDAYAAAVFYKLYPTQRKAPAGMGKAKVFASNCRVFAEMTDKVLDRMK
jgi:hypothetical protein